MVARYEQIGFSNDRTINEIVNQITSKVRGARIVRIKPTLIIDVSFMSEIKMVEEILNKSGIRYKK